MVVKTLRHYLYWHCSAEFHHRSIQSAVSGFIKEEADAVSIRDEVCPVSIKAAAFTRRAEN